MNASIGPKYKKMNDLRPPFVFLSAAFEPSRKEVQEAIHHSRETKKARAFAPTCRGHSSSVKTPVKSSSKKSEADFESLFELSDSSDDELPDLSELLAERKPPSKGKGKRRSESRSRPKNSSSEVSIQTDLSCSYGLANAHQRMITTMRRKVT